MPKFVAHRQLAWMCVGSCLMVMNLRLCATDVPCRGRLRRQSHLLLTLMVTNLTASTPPASFSISERVLCYHSLLVYEAKILKSEHWDESNTKNGEQGPHYYISVRLYPYIFANSCDFLRTEACISQSICL